MGKNTSEGGQNNEVAGIKDLHSRMRKLAVKDPGEILLLPSEGSKRMMETHSWKQRVKGQVQQTSCYNQWSNTGGGCSEMLWKQKYFLNTTLIEPGYHKKSLPTKIILSFSGTT